MFNLEIKMLASSVVGMKEDDAVEKIKNADCISRVVARDGEYFIVTMDLRGDRINLTIKNGIVKSADLG